MSISSVSKGANAVRAQYEFRVQSLRDQIDALRMRRRWPLLAVFTGCAVSAVLLIAALSGDKFLFAVLTVPAIAMVWGLRSLLRSRAKSIALARRSSFYERGIDRLEDNWRGKGNTGTVFMRDHHLYQSDLDILGEGSLFELLATTRTEAGAERLASFLLQPPPIHEAIARQGGVKELRDATSLREEVAVLGKYDFQDCRHERFRTWLKMPILRTPRFVPILLLVSGTLSLLLGLCGYIQMLTWGQIAPVLALLLIVQAAISLKLMRRIRVHIQALLAIAGDVTVLRQGIELIERQQFSSQKLRNLVEQLHLQMAASRILKLERLIVGLEKRNDFILYAFSLWIAGGTQLVFAVERWRALHQNDFEDWLDAWAEFEALNALATYSWERPDDVFPDLLDGDASYQAENLGHPLLPRDRCVGNDVALNDSTAFYLISGSNMAGKSTFLRAIGLNAVLALAGAPVRALRASMSVFEVCASIAVNDSLLEGKSKFLAECERLRDSIAAARTGRPVLFLIDEVLSGTNSRDRKFAAEALIGALVAAGAVGALSTHDLALTEIGENPRLKGFNVHMESGRPDEPFAFDYRVKPGISRQTNALAIVRMMDVAT